LKNLFTEGKEWEREREREREGGDGGKIC